MTSAEAVARSDAAFDGRDFDHLPRHERERYIKRAAAGIKADPVRAEMLAALHAFVCDPQPTETWLKMTGLDRWMFNNARAAIAKAEASHD